MAEKLRRADLIDLIKGFVKFSISKAAIVLIENEFLNKGLRKKIYT